MGRIHTVVVAGLVATGTLGGGLALSRTLELGPYHTPPPSVPDAAVSQRAAQLAAEQERLEEAMGMEPPALPGVVSAARRTSAVAGPPLPRAGRPGTRRSGGSPFIAAPSPGGGPAPSPAGVTTTGSAPAPGPAPLPRVGSSAPRRAVAAPPSTAVPAAPSAPGTAGATPAPVRISRPRRASGGGGTTTTTTSALPAPKPPPRTTTATEPEPPPTTTPGPRRPGAPTTTGSPPPPARTTTRTEPVDDGP